MKSAEHIEAIISDVDGVLTDGGITIDNQGIETKTFYVRDGLGIRLWLKAGYQFGILTARTSQIVRLRANELGIDPVLQGVSAKGEAVLDVAAQWSLDPQAVCYIGDDLSDISVFRQVGLGVAVHDGVSELRESADHITTARGGRGCIRELIEELLKQRGRWDDLIRKYTQG